MARPAAPTTASPIIDVVPGQIERWIIGDVANSRFFNIALAGHTFRVIGSDGGMIAKPYDTEEVLVSVAERVEVLVQFNGQPGDEVALIAHHYNRGHEMIGPDEVPLALIRYGNQLANRCKCMTSWW